MKLPVVLVCILCLAELSAQDLAPQSMADVIYTARAQTADRLTSVHAGVLLRDGTRTQISVFSPLLLPSASYIWTKTGANTGTLTLTGEAAVKRLTVTFTSNGTGTCRETTEGSELVFVGDFWFSPIPKDAAPVLANVSARVTLVAGQPAIAGFVVNGSVPRRVLVRGIGPSLAQFGVVNPATNPSLTVFKGANQVAANSGWGGGANLAAIFSAVGAFALPVGSRDCAVVLTLDPGLYTAQARGETGSEVLLEVYFVD